MAILTMPAAALKIHTLSACNPSIHPSITPSTQYPPNHPPIHSQAFTLRHLQLWAVPEPADYSEGHFLSYSPRPAARLWRIAVQSEGKQQWRQHLRLLQEQLQAHGLATLHTRCLAHPLPLPCPPPAFPTLRLPSPFSCISHTASCISRLSRTPPPPIAPHRPHRPRLGSGLPSGPRARAHPQPHARAAALLVLVRVGTVALHHGGQHQLPAAPHAGAAPAAVRVPPLVRAPPATPPARRSASPPRLLRRAGRPRPGGLAPLASQPPPLRDGRQPRGEHRR